MRDGGASGAWTVAPSGSRCAFTLIELLVVIVVVGILAGFVLRGVQAVREAARRAQCSANLKQLGIAMHSYYGVHRMFPPAELLTRADGLSANYASQHVFLLDYMEYGNLYDSINTDLLMLESSGFPSLENHTARNTRIDLFLCPSDGEPNHLNSYRFNRGRFETSPGSYYDGPFSYGVLPSEVVITDGLSQTAFMSERLGGSFSPGKNDSRRDLKSVTRGLTIVSDAQYIPLCLADQPGTWNPLAGRYWFYSGFVNTHYNHNGRPNDPRPTCVVPSLTDFAAGGLSPPRSFHPGTVNVLFGDSHIQIVTDTIEGNVWEAIGTYGSGD